MTDEFANRMKHYEAQEAQRRFMPLLPICARIDGKGFSKFTRGFEKPFDHTLGMAMTDTTMYLVEKTHALIGYTQSDEISLVWEQPDYNSQVWFDGRIQKMCSTLAAMATTKFSMVLSQTHPSEVAERLPVFDCRVWQVPNRMEAVNVLLWRAQDARKNAVSSACRSEFSPKQMFGKNQTQMKQMLLEAGVDFDTEYNESDRFGDFFRRVTREEFIDDATWEKIPPKHRDAVREKVLRSRVEALNLGYFGEVSNRVEVVFEGAGPIYHYEIEGEEPLMEIG